MKKKLAAALLLVCLLFGFSACGGGDYIVDESKKLSSYEITAKFDEQSKTLEALETFKWKNDSGETLNEAVFHLYPNAFREDAVYKPVSKQDFTSAYPNGASYGGIEISSVTAGGNEVDFSIGGEDKNLLVVPLGRDLPPGGETVIEIKFTDTLPNAAHRYGYTDNNYSFGNWYPVLCVRENGGWVTTPYYSNGDPFYSVMANYTVSVTYPAWFTAAATGDFSVTKSGGAATLTSTALTVRDFAFVLSDKFKVKTLAAGETTVSYYYFDDDNAEENLRVAAEAVKTFGEMISGYPYAGLCVAQTDFVYGGMEYPNLVYVASGLDDATMKQVIVHEIAHQWWYNLVGNNQAAHAWMDEGLTEFTTALFFKKNTQYSDEINFDKTVRTLERNYTMFVDVMESMGNADTSMDRAVNEYATEQEYVCMTYTKGTLMFENLMFSIGQNRFEKCLKRYFRDFRCGVATPDGMIDSFQKACGVNLQGFFSEWLEGKVVIG